MFNTSYFTNIPPVVKNLVIICTGIFLVMQIPAVGSSFQRLFALYYFTSAAFRPYQIFTYMFLHGSFMHLFFNMFALFMFGRTIEMVMGSKRFLFYYITCGLCAAFVEMGVFAYQIHHLSSLLPPEVVTMVEENGYRILHEGYYFNPDIASLNAYINTPMVGASGAIYGVLLAFGFLFPNMPVYLFFVPVPIKAKWIVLGYFVLELMYGVTGSADGVAHFAHLGGMIFGFLMLLYWKRKGVFTNHWFF